MINQLMKLLSFLHYKLTLKKLLSFLHYKLLKLLRPFLQSSGFYETDFKRKLYKGFFNFIQILTGRKKFLYSGKKSLINHVCFEMPWLSSLFQQGYVLIHNEKLPHEFMDIHEKTIQIALDIANNQNLIFASPSKNYLHRADLSKLPWETINSLYRYFTHPIFLETAEIYLGDQPLLTELKVLVSPPNHSSELEGSQLWHSDFDDSTNLKIFVFLDDIDWDCGPLQAVPKYDSSVFMRDIGYKWGVVNISHNDLNVPETYTKPMSFVGSQGTICLIDTVSCLHRGSRHPKRPRKILYATYNTRTSFRFIPWNWIGLRHKINSGSSPLIALDPELRFLDSNALNI